MTDYDLYIADIEHERMKMEEFMKREIIEIKNLKLKDIESLKDYVWKGDILIPVEMLDGGLNEKN